MYFYLSQRWFTVQFVFMIHFFLVLPNASFVACAKKVLASGIAAAYRFFFFFLQKNTVDCARLQEEAEQWEQFITRDENIQAQAAATQKFWQECPAKISVSCSWHQQLLSYTIFNQISKVIFIESLGLLFYVSPSCMS